MMKTLKLFLKTAVLSGLLLCLPFMNPLAHADEWSGYRNILSFGCHKGDGTCFVEVDGAPINGGSTCIGNSIRWDAKKEANGKSIFALIAIAKATNKKVGFAIQGCYSLQPQFPTFVWAMIE